MVSRQHAACHGRNCWNGLLCFHMERKPFRIQYSGSISGNYVFSLPFLLDLDPLCGILDSLEPEESTQRHPLSVVRVAIDPGKAYQLSRCIYFTCCPISAIIFIAVLPSGLLAYALFSWCAFPYMLISVASIMALASV